MALITQNQSYDFDARKHKQVTKSTDKTNKQANTDE